MRYPFLLKPAAKNYIWGGNRLNDEFSKNINMSPLAETWECSTHSDGLSVVASGEFSGKTLDVVLKEHPEFLGAHPVTEGELPILIKFIDARKDLSVQVHPTDEYASTHENGQLGKSEMWCVLGSDPDANIVFGLSRNCSPDEIRKAIDRGDLEKYLRRIPVKKNDVYFVKSGTIHSLGAGTIVAEIQENSNLTYRLYDYDRRDREGNRRELHIEKALAVSNLDGNDSPRQPMRVLKFQPGIAYEFLGSCKYFQVYRMFLNTERRQKVCYRADELSFRVLLCTKGCGSIRADSLNMDIYKGDCIFFPADSVEVEIKGSMQLLDVRG